MPAHQHCDLFSFLTDWTFVDILYEIGHLSIADVFRLLISRTIEKSEISTGRVQIRWVGWHNAPPPPRAQRQLTPTSCVTPIADFSLSQDAKPRASRSTKHTGDF